MRVANSHSWYKHLPTAADSSRFEAFCDLTSNMRRQDGRYVEYTQDDGTYFHYTWMTTESYRRRFGYFRYEVDHRHIDNRRGAAKNVDGSSIFIPKSARPSAVSVTAVVHDRSPGWNHYAKALRTAVDLGDPSILFGEIPIDWVQRHHVEGGRLPKGAAKDLYAIAEVFVNAGSILMKEQLAKVMNERFIKPYESVQLFTMEHMPKQEDGTIGEWARLVSIAQRHRERTAIRRSLHKVSISTYGADVVPSLESLETTNLNRQHR